MYMYVIVHIWIFPYVYTFFKKKKKPNGFQSGHDECNIFNISTKRPLRYSFKTEATILCTSASQLYMMLIMLMQLTYGGFFKNNIVDNSLRERDRQGQFKPLLILL